MVDLAAAQLFCFRALGPSLPLSVSLTLSAVSGDAVCLRSCIDLSEQEFKLLPVLLQYVCCYGRPME